jgi:hypothetical protein
MRNWPAEWREVAEGECLACWAVMLGYLLLRRMILNLSSGLK